MPTEDEAKQQQRREVIEALWQMAKAGHIAAQKKIVELTRKASEEGRAP